MKTTFRILAAGLAASLALVSCDKESLTKSDNGASKEGARVVTVSFSHTTKSALGEDGLTPHFTNDDVIKVFRDLDTENCTVSVGDDGTATISINSDALKTGPLTAVYPAAAWKNSAPYFTVSTEQDGTFAKANICTATIPDGANSKVEFENQTAILKFYVDESIGVSQIKIEGEGVATGKNTITVNPSSSETLYNVGGGSDARICYAAVLPVSGTNITLTSTTTTQSTVSRPISSATIAANKIYNAFIPYYIDLGDAGKWGYCNVGAFLPEEYGLYFAWGEVNGHNWSGTPNHEGYLTGAFASDFVSFDHSDLRYNVNTWNGSSGFADCNTPYFDGNYFSTSKYKDGSIATLELSDDAANVQWGGSWRMPTIEEFSSLAAWDPEYNVWDATNKGYRLTDEKENSIFLPAAGYGYGTDLFDAGGRCYYWSSSLNTGRPGSALYLYFFKGTFSTDNGGFYRGQPVRPLSD